MTVKVRWLPSHLHEQRSKDSEFILPAGVSDYDVDQNDIVDREAGKMARKYEVCFDTQSKYYKTLKLVSLIQMRLVTIIQNLPSRPKPIVKPVKVTKYTSEHCATL